MKSPLAPAPPHPHPHSPSRRLPPLAPLGLFAAPHSCSPFTVHPLRVRSPSLVPRQESTAACGPATGRNETAASFSLFGHSLLLFYIFFSFSFASFTDLDRLIPVLDCEETAATAAAALVALLLPSGSSAAPCRCRRRHTHREPWNSAADVAAAAAAGAEPRSRGRHFSSRSPNHPARRRGRRPDRSSPSSSRMAAVDDFSPRCRSSGHAGDWVPLLNV